MWTWTVPHEKQHLDICEEAMCIHSMRRALTFYNFDFSMLKKYQDKSQRIMLTECEGPLFTWESLPPYIIPINSEVFVKMTYYLGEVQVHISTFELITSFKKYNGYLSQSYQAGICLTPLTWNSFCKELRTFKKMDPKVIIGSNICFQYESIDGKESYTFKHKNARTYLRLSEEDLSTLRRLSPIISLKLLDIAIKQRVLYFYLTDEEKEFIRAIHKKSINYTDPPDYSTINDLIRHAWEFSEESVDYAELSHAFQLHLKDLISGKLIEKPTSFCFYELVYSMDYVQIAKDFEKQHSKAFDGVDMFRFYESIDFCEFLRLLQDSLM